MYSEDVDAAIKKAVDAGATVTTPAEDMFWGDRFGTVADPYGHQWGIAMHVEDIPPEEMAKRGEAAMEEMMSQGRSNNGRGPDDDLGLDGQVERKRRQGTSARPARTRRRASAACVVPRPPVAAVAV